MISEVEEAMIIEVKGSQQQQRLLSQVHEQQSFNPELFGLNFQSLTALKNAVLDAPMMDFLRIEQLKREIASGCYAISGDGIAGKMLSC